MKKIFKKIDTFFLVYFGLYALLVILGDFFTVTTPALDNLFYALGQILGPIYVFTFVYVFLFYSLCIVIFEKHRTFIMNIIDGILCYILTGFIPFPLFTRLYYFSKPLYTVLSYIFVFLPFVYSFIDKEKIDYDKIKKVLTRTAMIVVVVTIILSFESCGTGIQG